MTMDKFVMSSGHAKYVSGASKYLNEVTEARKITDKVAEYLKQIGATVHVFHDNASKDVSTNLRTITNYHNSKVRDLDISIHLNAGGGTGVEVLYKTEQGMSVKVSKVIADSLGLKDRGAKKRTDLYVLNNTIQKAILLEICFVDSQADKVAYEKNFDKMCRAIAECLTGKKIPQPKPIVKTVSKPIVAQTDTLYRVVAGSYADKTLAQNQVEKLKKSGFDSFILPFKK